MNLADLFQYKMRPLGPKERRDNPDGSYSTEITATVPYPDGGYANVPTLWNRGGQMVEIPEDQAARTAFMLSRMAGVPVKTFPSISSAVSSAETGSAAGGRTFLNHLLSGH